MQTVAILHCAFHQPKPVFETIELKKIVSQEWKKIHTLTPLSVIVYNLPYPGSYPLGKTRGTRPTAQHARHNYLQAERLIRGSQTSAKRAANKQCVLTHTLVCCVTSRIMPSDRHGSKFVPFIRALQCTIVRSACISYA